MPGPIANPDSQNTHDKRPVVESNGKTASVPTWLTEPAKKIFKDARKKLQDKGISDSSDRDVLALYAMQFARVQEMSARTDRDGRAEKLLNDLTGSVFSLAKDLGLSPGGRARMRIVAPVEAFNPDVFFEKEK